MHIAPLLIPDFLLIVMGYLLCRFTALGRPMWVAVEQLVYFFLFPVLLFHSIVRSPIELGSAGRLMGAGLALGATGIALAWVLPHVPGLRGRFESRAHAAGAQVAFRFNSFIGLALAERVLGPQGLQWIAVLIGVCVPLFNVAAVWPMARHGGHALGRELLRNPLILATVSGLVLSLSGVGLPTELSTTLSRIGAASIALGLMTAGAGLQMQGLAGAKVLGAAVLLIRHAVLPGVAWVLGRAFGLGAPEAVVLLIFAGLPTSSSCYVLAARMGYNGPFVAALVTLSTLLGAFSLPWALWLAGY